MYLARLKLAGFRPLNCDVSFCPGFAILAGENNAGKSNVIDAIRLLLHAEAGPREGDEAIPRVVGIDPDVEVKTIRKGPPPSRNIPELLGTMVCCYETRP